MAKPYSAHAIPAWVCLIGHLLVKWTHPDHFQLKLNLFPYTMNAALALQTENSQNSYDERYGERTRMGMWRCKWLHNTEWCLDVNTWINRPKSPWWVQNRKPNRWSQWDLLQRLKTCHRLPKTVLRYVPNLENDGLVVLHRADDAGNYT